MQIISQGPDGGQVMMIDCRKDRSLDLLMVGREGEAHGDDCPSGRLVWRLHWSREISGACTRRKGMK